MKFGKYIKKATALTAAAALSVTAAISASAAEDISFFEQAAQRDANGNKPGYVDLATIPNGNVHQQLYNDLYQECIDFWNSNVDVEPVKLDDGAGNGYNLFVFKAIPASQIIPGMTKAETAEQQYELLAEGYKFFMNYMADNPIFYFLYSMKVTLVNTDDKTLFLILIPEEYASGSDRAAVQSNIIDFYGQAPALTEGKSTLAQKHMALYQYLCDNMTYAYQKDENGNYILDDAGNKVESFEAFAHTIVAPAVNKEGVCEGYARSYELLCNLAGLESVFSVGACYDPSDSSQFFGHAWNYIKLDDGNFYGIDATWDDQIQEDENLRNNPAFALNVIDGKSHVYFGDGKTRFLNGRKDCDHNTQTEFGTTREIGGKSIFVKVTNFFEYEIDQVAGVARPDYDYVMPGDVNNDLEFDMRDLIRLGKFTVNPSETHVAKAAANADGIGEINMLDAVHLQKSLLGYESNVPQVDVENYPSRT